MPVSAQSPITSAVANGATTVFPFAFLVLQASDLVVQVTDSSGVPATKALGADYTLSGVGSALGGTVTFLAAPANLSVVVIYRSSQLVRSTNYVDRGDLLAAVLNSDFDRLWLLLQEIVTGSRSTVRALQVPVGETVSVLPVASARAGKFPVFDAGGDVTTSSGTGADAGLRTDLAAFGGSALVSFLAPGGAIASRPVQTKLREIVSVTDYGADPTGSADSTAAFQAALNRATTVIVPPGTYKLTAPLTATRDSALIGTHPEMCQLFRTTAYGNTLVASPGGSLTVKGLWFRHQYTFNNGASYIAGTSTSITNKDPTSSHLKITNGQNVRIEDCWFSGLGWGINLTDTAVIWIRRCTFDGMWNANVAALQDTTASIFLQASTYLTRCVTAHITDNNITSGYAAAATNVTTPPGGGAGSVTVSHQLNAGPRYGIHIQSCEEFKIADNYIGGQSQHSIYLQARAILAHGQIHDNMLDAAAQYSIKLEGSINTTDQYPNFISIHHNTGVGYGIDYGFVTATFTGGVTYAATYIDISHNTVQYYLRAPILLQKVFGAKIAGNQVIAYNSDGATTVANDPTCQAGAYVDAACQYVDSIGNSWGGSINAPGGAGFAKWGIYFAGTTNNTCGLERNNGLGLAGGSLNGGLAMTYPV